MAEYDPTLPDGTVLKQPGRLFHTITEPLFWGTDKGHVKLEADLNGNGAADAGEVLFDANLALGAATGMVDWGDVRASVACERPADRVCAMLLGHSVFGHRPPR